QKYLAGNLDADFRGFGPGGEAPNGNVDSWDINGFTSRYTQALAGGTRLEDLPTSGGQGMASGAPAPLPLAADSPKESATSGAAASASVLADSPEIDLLTQTADPAPAGETDAAASPLADEPASLAPPSADAFTAALLVVSDETAAPDSAAWSPAASDMTAAASGLDGNGDLADVLAVPALDVSLGA
ncbi:MAG: hypothetical protein AMS14_11205, partial [Planctomycetes bacterium DG_20]